MEKITIMSSIFAHGNMTSLAIKFSVLLQNIMIGSETCQRYKNKYISYAILHQHCYLFTPMASICPSFSVLNIRLYHTTPSACFGTGLLSYYLGEWRARRTFNSSYIWIYPPTYHALSVLSADEYFRRPERSASLRRQRLIRMKLPGTVSDRV